jgi:hypothetical protein
MPPLVKALNLPKSHFRCLVMIFFVPVVVLGSEVLTLFSGDVCLFLPKVYDSEKINRHGY